MSDTDNTLDEQDVEPGLLRKLLGTLMTPVSIVGNVLDTPGAMVRNTLAGENPFKGLFDPEQRTSAGDLLRNMGLIDKEDTWSNLGGRLAAGIVTDPLTYINPFATLGKLSGLTKGAGEAAQKSGLLKYLPQVTSSPRTYLKQNSLETLLKDISGLKGVNTEAVKSGLDTALETIGKKAGGLADDIMQQPLKKDLAVGLPFFHQSGVANLPGGDTVAAFLDKMGDKARWSLLGRTAAAGLSSDATGGTGAMTKEGQLAGQLYKINEDINRADVRRKTLGLMDWRNAHKDVSPEDFGKLIESPNFADVGTEANQLGLGPAGSFGTTQGIIGPATYQDWEKVGLDELNKMSPSEIAKLYQAKEPIYDEAGKLMGYRTVRMRAAAPEQSIISSGTQSLDQAIADIAAKSGVSVDDLRQARKMHDAIVNPLVEAERAAGGNVQKYLGDLNYASRQGTFENEVIPGLEGGRPYGTDAGNVGGSPHNRTLSANMGQANQREDIIRNLPRDVVNRVAKDKVVNAVIDGGGSREDVINALINRYGPNGTEAKNLIPSLTRMPGKGQETLQSTWGLLADKLGSLTAKTREYGLFANDPLADLQSRLLSGSNMQSRMDTLLNTLTRDGVVGDATTALRHPETKSVNHILDALNVNKKTFVNRLAEANDIVSPSVEEFGNTLNEALSAAGHDTIENLSENFGKAIQEGRKHVRESLKAAGIKLKDMPEELSGVLDDAKDAWSGYKDALKELTRSQVSTPVARDLERLYPRFKEPGYVETMLQKFVDPITNLTKGSLTGPWPGFQSRNWLSEKIRSWTDMASSGEARAAMNAVLKGKELDPSVVKTFAESPTFQSLAKQFGYDTVDENTLKPLVSKLLYAHEMGGMGEVGNVIGKEATSAKTLEKMLAEAPGGLPGAERTATTGDIAKQAADAYLGRKEGTSLMPPVIGDAYNYLRGKLGYDEVPVGQMRGWKGATEQTFGPSVGGDIIGNRVYEQTRGESFLSKLLQGMTPEEAAKQTLNAHVDYSGRAYTELEKQLTRLFPFYKFSKKNLAYTAEDLLHNPGGRTAQLIRASNEAQGKNAEPEYLTGSLAVPLGEDEAGNKRYLSGLGMMHEAALPFMSGMKEGGNAILNALNPLVKAPLEQFTGRSFFQTDAMGEPRALADQEGRLGRILANVTGQSEPVAIPQLLEHILANSPASRLESTIGQLTDPRKGVGGYPVPGLASLLNTLTGIRVTDVSPRAREQQLGEALKALMQESGARAYEDVYFPKEMLANLPPEKAQALSELQQLQKALAKARRDRQKAAKTAA